jgi:peptidoglycan/xylan/chitin deacetylase (PgdA/CDA1 family)
MADVLVLCYHAVSPTWPAPLSVTPDALDRQLARLVDRGYRGATFTEAVLAPPARRTLAVTFDDAFRSVLDAAKPILDRHGLPGTLFVPTDWPGRDEPMRWPGIERWLGTEHEHELRALSWEEIGALAAAGWEIGSHTCSHPHLPRLDDATLAHELDRSRATIERRLGRACTALAYPYGSVDARVERAAATAGYAAAAALPRLLYPPRPLCWPRTGVYHDDTPGRFRLKASPALRRARRSGIGERVELARLARRGGP